jgi:hypothetical protein
MWDEGDYNLNIRINEHKSKFSSTGFVDFIQRPEFWISMKHNVSETGSVSVLRWEEGDTYCWVSRKG